MPVVDASVCVALFKADEPGHEASRTWLGAATESREPVVAPVTLLPEVAAALGRGAGDEELALRVVALLRSTRLVQLFPVTEGLAERAARIAAGQRIRGGDALYVALAAELRMELVTLDRQQFERGAEVIATRRL